jgi:hypothetical protein
MSKSPDYPPVCAYLDWARSQACEVELSTSDRFGHPVYQHAKITAPDGRFAVAIFIDDDDPLMSTTVAYLDRRLGLKSYLFV